MFGVYFSPNQRIIVCGYKLHEKPIMKEKQTFSLVSDIDNEKTFFFFIVKLTLLMKNF